MCISESAKEVMKNSKALSRTGYLELLDSCVTPKYFEYFKNMPCLEIFSKMRMYSLVIDILKKDMSDIPKYLRETGKESRLSKLSKPQIKAIQASHPTLKMLVAYMRVLNRDSGAMYDVFETLARRSHERHIVDIMCVEVPGMTVAKIKDYIERVDDAQCCPPAESLQLWSDYLRMLKNLECDLTDNKLIYPNSLKREHDKASRKLRQVKDDALNEKFVQRAVQNDWLAYKGSKYSAIIPHEITELYEEGRKLNHCVGTYAKAVSEGTSIIAFIRSNNMINSPYCTVEIRKKTIVQAKGYSNNPGLTIPGIKGFLLEWSKEKGLTLDVA